MLDLMIASLFLPVSHFGLSSTRVRDLLVHRLSEQRFLAVYKSITVATLVWLGIAYKHAPLYRLWTPLYATKLIVSAVVLAAFFLIVGGITTPNPTIVGSEGLFDEPDVVRGVIRVTRNSFLWGVALWASAHIAATGDVASVLMFGSIGSLGLIGAPLLDAKKARRHGEKWRQFAAHTSSLPFLAIVQSRQHLAMQEIGWLRIGAAASLFAAASYAHRFVFGVSALP